MTITILHAPSSTLKSSDGDIKDGIGVPKKICAQKYNDFESFFFVQTPTHPITLYTVSNDRAARCCHPSNNVSLSAARPIWILLHRGLYLMMQWDWLRVATIKSSFNFHSISSTARIEVTDKANSNVLKCRYDIK